MRGGLILAGLVLATGCKTVTLARLDECTVQRTKHWGNTEEKVLYCDGDKPAWSYDRTVRMTQECLYHARLARRDEQMIALSEGRELPPMKDEDVIARCYPESMKALQAENDLLRDRATRSDAAQASLNARHDKLQEAVAKSLERPISAVAESSSSSGSDVKSDLAGYGNAPVVTQPVKQELPVVTPRKVRKVVTGTATAQKDPPRTCAAPAPCALDPEKK